MALLAGICKGALCAVFIVVQSGQGVLLSEAKGLSANSDAAIRTFMMLVFSLANSLTAVMMGLTVVFVSWRGAREEKQTLGQILRSNNLTKHETAKSVLVSISFTVAEMLRLFTIASIGPLYVDSFKCCGVIVTAVLELTFTISGYTEVHFFAFCIISALVAMAPLVDRDSSFGDFNAWGVTLLLSTWLLSQLPTLLNQRCTNQVVVGIGSLRHW